MPYDTYHGINLEMKTNFSIFFVLKADIFFEFLVQKIQY